MQPRLTLVVFLGTRGATPVEQMVASAIQAATLDSIEDAQRSDAFDRVIVATDSDFIEGELPEVTVDIDSGPFHFGTRLSRLIDGHALSAILYMGGGSVPLFGSSDFYTVATAVKARHPVVVTNNAFSSDIAAFPVTPGILDALRTLDRDNSLARTLEERDGITLEELPRTLATQFDIDGPSDLMVLALTGQGGPRVHAHLESLELDVSRHERVLPLFINREAQIVVAGRVGSHSWRYLERETACRVRLFAEERGLEAEGRTAAARSLLGFFIQAEGIKRFFEVLAQLGDAAFIDTRVLLAHMRIEATREDRFLSDMGAWDQISDPFLRDFTRAAAEAPIPVILGGHSLMSGGLMALNEFAWRQQEAER